MMVSTASLTVSPVTPAIGAEVTGVDLRRPLDDRTVADVREAFVRHHVLFFRDQHLDTAQHLAFARYFGSILIFPTVFEDNPEYPGVQRVVVDSPLQRADGGRATGHWHIDASGLRLAPFASVLRAINLPPVGGDTIWASGVAAYAGLSTELKETIDELYVTHDVTRHFRARGIDYPMQAYPLVRIHPESGEKVLFVNFLTQAWVIGWDRAESTALLARLKEEYTRPEYQVRFRWTPGTLVMWDNRAVQHYAVRDYGDFPRTMERVLVANPNPVVTERLG